MTTTATRTQRPATPPELDTARELAAAGLPIFVAKPNPNYDKAAPSGHPNAREFLFPTEWEKTPADPAALDAWRPGWAVCMVTGHGFDGVDVDTKNGASTAEQLERLSALGVRVFAQVLTPSGGAHFYVQSSGICTTSNPDKGVDFRGLGLDGTGGGLLYLPGTSRPKYDGGGYAWLVPFLAEDTDELPQRDAEQTDAIATYLNGLGVKVRTRREKAPATEVGGEPLPAKLPDWLRNMLSDLGPTWVTADDTTSADRSERFHNLVGGCYRANLTQGQTVTAVTPWCEGVGKYVGRVASAVALSWSKVAVPSAGSVPGESGKKFDEQPAQTPPEWGTPEPLHVAPTPPRIPLDGLPAYLRDMVEAVAEETQAPREVVLAAALGTLAAATRGVWDTWVHPGWCAGPSVLWAIALADSGERKSSAFSHLTRPLREAERAVVADIIKANRNRAQERARLAALRKKADTENDEQAAARYAEREYEHRARPVPTFIRQDGTVEAVGLQMSNEGGALAIFGSEAVSLQNAAGRYADGAANFGLWNNAYDGDAFSDVRIRRDPIRVERPTLSWAVAVQPAVMGGFADTHSDGSGFLGRFMLLVSENRVGTRNYRSQPVPLAVSERWAAVVTALHAAAWERYSAMIDGLPDEPLGPPAALRFTPEAAELVITYAEKLEAQKAPGSPLRSIGAWAEKHHGRVARLAAVLALAERPQTMTVKAEHVQAALSIADPLIGHALAAFGVMRHATRTDPAERVSEILRRLNAPHVSTRSVYRIAKDQTAWCHNVADVRDALEELAGMGWVVGPYDANAGKRIKPSEHWHVHPDLLS